MRVLWVWLILCAFWFSPALGAEPPSWWASLSATDRYGVQGDLILLGFYDGFVDGQYGPQTEGALKRFQLSTGDSERVPSQTTLGRLRQEAQQEFERMGMQLERFPQEGVAAYVPRNVLTVRTEGEGGVSFATDDGSMVMYLTGYDNPAGSGSLEQRAVELLRPSYNRTVTYKSIKPDRIVVSGRQAGDAYYSVLTADGDKIIGVSVIWGNEYASLGAITATFAASYSGRAEYFEENPTEVSTGLAALEGERIGRFILPKDEPKVIVLAGDIATGAMLDLRRALKARPDATTLLLDSIGGSVNEGLLLAHAVADRGLATYVPADAGCYSACAYVFFAGKARAADGSLGVHQIYGDGVSVSDAQAVLSDVLDALAEFDVPQAVISAMLRTRPDQMHVFTDDEKDLLQLNRGSIDRANLAAPEGASGGLTVMRKNSTAEDLASQRTERILTVREPTKWADLMLTNGFTARMVEAITPAILGQYPSATLPAGARMRILFGASRTSEVLIPYRVSLYTHDQDSGEDRHMATVALTDRGSYVAGAEPRRIDFPTEDLPPSMGGKSNRAKSN
ncbi:MAG: hypothetical protein J0I48_08410 [Devosia sp.]|uniref:peptidoglycan-binding protein n=1 Tax=Devosia sp. 66-22 TaxID=1895753 RepID=UPI001AC42DDF|nr:peptidoglycan-binding protein [Devosia sp. 66-22]MBN9346209.1 hypothetical protein [Devosia sp.]